KRNIIKISETLNISLDVLKNEEQNENNRLKKSLGYAFISYCIIFALTLLVRAIREPIPYTNILSKDISEIIKIVIVTFGQKIYIAIVPAIIIGLVFYFYIIPRQLDN